MNCLMSDKGRTKLAEDRMNGMCWNEVILCATYLLNRTVTTILRIETAPEAIFNNGPSNSKVRCFRRTASKFMYIENRRSKFNKRAKIDVYLSSREEMFGIYILSSQSMMMTKYAEFVAKKIPFENFWTSNSEQVEEGSERYVAVSRDIGSTEGVNKHRKAGRNGNDTVQAP